MKLRIGIWALTTAVAVWLVFAAMTGVTLSTPWRSAGKWSPVLVEAQPIAGETGVVADGVVLRGADGNGVTAVLWPVDEALTGKTVARVCVEGVDSVSRVELLWQRDGQLYRQVVPGLGNGCQRLNLDMFAGWNEQITAIGLALLPSDYLPPAAAPPREVQLSALELHDDNLSDRVLALADWWLAYRPWKGRSINTQGFALGAEAGPSLNLFVVLAGLIAGLLAAVTRLAAPGKCLSLAVVASVGLLAVGQLGQMLQRGHEAQVAASTAEAEGASLGALPAMTSEAKVLAELLEGREVRRMLIGSKERFPREYALWWLRAQDAAFVWPEQWAGMVAALQGNDLIVMVGRDDSWSFDPATTTLQLGNATLGSVEPVYQGDLLFAFAPNVEAAAEVSQ